MRIVRILIPVVAGGVLFWSLRRMLEEDPADFAVLGSVLLAVIITYLHWILEALKKK